MMRVYLDVSCLGRLFDDAAHPRIATEANAVLAILDRCDAGDWQLVSSQVALWEIGATPNVIRRDQMLRLLADPADILQVTPAIFERAQQFEALHLRGMDALHVAACEAAKVERFVTCDDRLLRWCRRHRRDIAVFAANPTELIDA